MTSSEDRDKQVTALRRILETPALAQVIPQLQPELLHKIIQSYGLEDCAEVVALATPQQLARVFDLDLWKGPRPGVEERLDAARFGAWLEVLMDAGAEVAAAKLTGMDPDLVIGALSQHVRVCDRAADVRSRSNAETFEIGGVVLEARREDAWGTIIDLLLHLDAHHGEYFRTIMRGCRELSNEGFELDGLDGLLANDRQTMFDLAVERESRRDASGYVAPEQARVFLQMSRELALDQLEAPTTHPIAAAYFRALDWTPPAPDADETRVPPETSGAIAEVVELLTDAGVVAPPPRALLTGSTTNTSRLSRIEAFLATANMDEFGFLANAVVAGCPLKDRPFTEKESIDATLAVCNLGLENWPARWNPPASLIAVFQVGWRILYRDVVMHATEQLLGVLGQLTMADSETLSQLADLQSVLTKSWREGTPWKAREALDVIMILDTPAWASLLAVIAEYPVCPTDPNNFEFISCNDQVTAIHHFLNTLPSALYP